MNKWSKLCLAMLLLGSVAQAQAAFVLNGTRFIYPAGHNSIVATVRNEAKLTYGGQAWVAHPTPGTDQTNFIPSPTFFKLKPGQSQVVRILGVQASQLPTDRESLFLLNIQEIPPAPKEGANAISIAMNTQVKLIYRPESLAKARPQADRQLRFTRTPSSLRVENPTPYYLAITTLRLNDEKITVSAASDKALATLAPFSSVHLEESLGPGTLSADLLDDHGASKTLVVGKPQ